MKINVKLTKKDADIVALKKFLPERKFNETVIKILNAALRGEVARIPMEFEIVSVIGNSTTKIDLSPELIEKLESKFGRGKFTTKVKMLIRRCIRANLNELRTKRWSVDRAKMFFERAVSFRTHGGDRTQERGDARWLGQVPSNAEGPSLRTRRTHQSAGQGEGVRL